VAEFASAAFQVVGLDYKDFVKIDERYFRPTEVDALIGDPSKAERVLQWKSHTEWRQLAKIMVEAEVASIKGGN
jgi:GDPmannose 4,6-dehydratase